MRSQAEAFLDALVGTETCDEVWALMVSDGETRAEFCPQLDEYRTEVSALTLGELLESNESYTIFAVTVEYTDGSPSNPDSEMEIDVIDGTPKVALGLP